MGKWLNLNSNWIEHSMTTAYRPQANGMIERFHRQYFPLPKQESNHEESLRCAIEATAKAVSASYCSRASVPKMVVSTFDYTDLTKYNTFIAEFERVIERTCTDDTKKYQQLLQWISGFAKFLVSSHEQRDGSLAFNGAKKELQDQF